LREVRRNQAKALTSWKIANNAVKSKLFKELLHRHQDNDDGEDIGKKDRIMIKGKDYDFTKGSTMVDDDDDDDEEEEEEDDDDKAKTKNEKNVEDNDDDHNTDLTLCRLMIALHDLVEVPPAVAPHVVSIQVS
jgi:hypothetical protein